MPAIDLWIKGCVPSIIAGADTQLAFTAIGPLAKQEMMAGSVNRTYLTIKLKNDCLHSQSTHTVSVVFEVQFAKAE